MEALYRKLDEHGFAIFDALTMHVSTHKHRNLELAYVQSGSIEHIVNGEKHILHAGDYFIIDYAMCHSYNAIGQERLRVRNLVFRPRFLDVSLSGTCCFRELMSSYLLRFCYQTLRSDPTGITFHDTDGRIGALVNTITAEYRAEGYGYLEYIRSVLVEILILTMRKIGRNDNPDRRSKIVNQMIQYAESNYQKSLQLSCLAKELNYNAAYLSQKFSTEMGMPFTAYVHSIRVRKSCSLLENTDMKISQIAEAVGYRGSRYFNQIFKEHLSITPIAFRSVYKRGK